MPPARPPTPELGVIARRGVGTVYGARPAPRRRAAPPMCNSATRQHRRCVSIVRRSDADDPRHPSGTTRARAQPAGRPSVRYYCSTSSACSSSPRSARLPRSARSRVERHSVSSRRLKRSYFLLFVALLAVPLLRLTTSFIDILGAQRRLERHARDQAAGPWQRDAQRGGLGAPASASSRPTSGAPIFSRRRRPTAASSTAKAYGYAGRHAQRDAGLCLDMDMLLTAPAGSTARASSPRGCAATPARRRRAGRAALHGRRTASTPSHRAA